MAKRNTDSELILGSEQASLLDIVDNVLNKGVVLTGDLTIGLAQVDLIHARLSLLLCAADRVLPNEIPDVTERNRQQARRIDASSGGATLGPAVRASGRRRKT